MRDMQRKNEAQRELDPYEQHRSVRALLAMLACVPDAYLYTSHPDRLDARSSEALAK